MLTGTKARQAKAHGKPRKLADGAGLYLYVATSGAKSWRYDYRPHGRRETLTVGPYPEVTLAEARDRHFAARKPVERGESPAKAKRIQKAERASAGDHLFRTVAQTWYDEAQGC